MAVERADSDHIQALVFDFDGVIVDTEQSLYELWVETFEEFGCVLRREEWQAIVGTSGGPSPYEWLADRSSRTLPATAELRARISARELARVEALPPMPGILHWLDDAARRGWKLAVASSSSRRWVEGRLDHLGLSSRFTAVLCPDGVLRPKPEPDLYAAACRALGVEPSRSIAIEDSHHGVVAAVAAGLHCIAVPHGLTYDMDFSQADFVARSLEELAIDEALLRLGGGRRPQ